MGQKLTEVIKSGCEMCKHKRSSVKSIYVKNKLMMRFKCTKCKNVTIVKIGK